MPKICIDAGHFAYYNYNDHVSPKYWESKMAWKLHLMQKEELEKYGFTVILTRDKQENDLGLMARGQKAKGCDLFISDHSNACNTESVDRAVVIYPVNNKCLDLATQLSKTVTRVMALNDAPQIYNRWNSTHDADYYGVIRGAASVGVPGLIIEHSFHTNDRAAAWLNSEANLRKLAAEEAKTIAAYYGMEEENGMTEQQIKDFITQEVTRQAQAIKQEYQDKLAQISNALSKGYGEALTAALDTFSNTADAQITKRIGKEIVHLSDISSKKTRAEFSALLEAGFIDGGTPAEVDKTDVRLPWTVVRALIVAKRYTDARIAEMMIEDADAVDYDCGDACKIPLFEDEETQGDGET